MRKANYIISALMVALLTTHSLAGQETIFPKVDKISGRHPAQILRVDLTPAYTILDLYYVAESEESWVCIDKDFYISSSNFDERKYLIMVKGVSICPRMTKVNPVTQDIRFQLYFPPLGKGIYRLDAVESKSGMRFEGIHINNGVSSVIHLPPDSISVLSFLHTCVEETEIHDSLEGPWVRNTSRRHYNSTDALIGEHVAVPDTVFILKQQNNTYRIFNIEGKGMDETITRLTGDLGYFYKILFPEVNDAGSGYITFKDKTHFSISFLLPTRIAQYALLNEYLESDLLIENQDFVKLNDDDIHTLIQRLRETEKGIKEKP